MPLYETVFIARQDLTFEDVDNLSDKLSKIITDANGKILSKEYWGLRNLTYKIKKNTRGHYVMFNIEADFAAIAEMNRVMGFNEDIIRNVTLESDAETVKETSPLFVSKNAKDSKTAKAVDHKAPSKYDSIADQLQFDN